VPLPNGSIVPFCSNTCIACMRVSVFQSSASKFSAALLRGSMANNQRQGFRLVRVRALRLVWVVFFIFLTFECWVLTTGRLQEVRARVCGLQERENKAQLHLIYVVIVLHCVREEGISPPRNCIPRASRLPTHVLSRGPWSCTLRHLPCQVSSAWSAAPPDMSSVRIAISMAGDGTIVLSACPSGCARGGPLIWLVLALLKPNRLIYKHTNTDVALTQEYSRVSISTGNMKCTNPN
jgi:hypothetical protein